MNLLSKVATMVDGAKNLATWVGSGGEVVSQEVAQERAEICFSCPLNRRGSGVTKEVAEATHKFIEFKNSLELRVKGEEKLFHCAGCSCVLSLMVWEPQSRVKIHMDAPEIQSAPPWCWKLRP